jgi:hypothetical protein
MATGVGIVGKRDRVRWAVARPHSPPRTLTLFNSQPDVHVPSSSLAPCSRLPQNAPIQRSRETFDSPGASSRANAERRSRGALAPKPKQSPRKQSSAGLKSPLTTKTQYKRARGLPEMEAAFIDSHHIPDALEHAQAERISTFCKSNDAVGAGREKGHRSSVPAPGPSLSQRG